MSPGLRMGVFSSHRPLAPKDDVLVAAWGPAATTSPLEPDAHDEAVLGFGSVAGEILNDR